jgi:hypothetical protein
MAAGSADNAGPGFDTVAQSFDGKTWSLDTGAILSGYATGDDLMGVSCVTEKLCVAAGLNGNRDDFGNLVEVESHGAWTWDQITNGITVGAAGGLNAIACHAASNCMAVGPGGYVFNEKGSKWSMPVDIDGPATITALSCAGTATCVAVDSVGDALIARSGSWSAPLSIDPGFELSGVSCPTKVFCAAVDSAGAAVIGS